MMRFTSLEDLGLSIAAMTESSDGDCARVEARRSVCETTGASFERLTILNQMHGNSVLSADSVQEVDADLREGDGLVTREPSLPMGVLVADCVPVYLFDPVKRAGGIVHAGRAGTYSRIAQNAIYALEREHGVHASDLHAVIGPSAGPCCYEVSSEIARDFAGSALPVTGRYLDLWQANVLQLEGCGVPRSQIEVVGICTICDRRFHSYRRKPKGGRNLALLVL